MDQSDLDQNVRSQLPLTPVAFEVLLSLAGGEAHGYSIMKDIEQRTVGTIKLHPGTLYRVFHRLMQQGLIEELDERPDPALDDERRRYFGITLLGRRVATAEAHRLHEQVGAARARHLFGEGT